LKRHKNVNEFKSAKGTIPNGFRYRPSNGLAGLLEAFSEAAQAGDNLPRSTGPMNVNS
jgi:hypothetical protein